ncbi:hypothetical protein [Desulfospira joergensenii]|uniref:hypothetical protein n=1 Tax=Desulfospira joergensenii TaxID=53329 RepID=UPI000406EFEA|nr:hypothetical protein [Desulfospira joergensenii]
METKKIIKRYCLKDKAAKEQMWYYYPALRAEFDSFEKNGAVPPEFHELKSLKSILCQILTSIQGSVPFLRMVDL